MITPAQTWGRLKANPALLCAAILAAAGTLIYLLPWVWKLQMQLEYGYRAIDLAQRDFVNYWMAGRMVLAGTEHELFTQATYFARLQELFGSDIEIRAWSYPPHFLLMLWPLGYLDYMTALPVFLLATFALFVAAVWTFRVNLATRSDRAIVICALFGFTVVQLDATQNGFLTAAFLLFGFAWMRQRPLLAGLAFACLTIKPQLGILIPVLLLWDRNWRTILWAGVFTLALLAASFALFGIDSWQAYFTETLAYQRFVMSGWSGIFLLMMPTVFGSVRALGLSAEVATAVQWPVSIGGALLLLWLLRMQLSQLERIFVVAAGTFLITPYAFNYDMGALSAIAAMLASAPVIARNRSSAVLMVAVAAMPVVVLNIGRAGLPIAPLLLATSLAVIALRGRTTALAELWRLAAERDVFSGKKVDGEGRPSSEDQREQRHTP